MLAEANGKLGSGTNARAEDTYPKAVPNRQLLASDDTGLDNAEAEMIVHYRTGVERALLRAKSSWADRSIRRRTQSGQDTASASRSRGVGRSVGKNGVDTHASSPGVPKS